MSRAALMTTKHDSAVKVKSFIAVFQLVWREEDGAQTSGMGSSPALLAVVAL